VEPIYAGVLVHHLDKFKEAAPGHEVIYVPSHRSHMDYLLLSYLLYDRGIVPPHIAAGINLNLPVVGTLLRKGGAFFMRRSFKGNPLYSAVFTEYVAQLVSGGYSIEYFIEGGRSRTGRLLQPKGGMISMTRAFLRQPRKPVLFQPVYIGYEKLMEGSSYLDELSGRPKEKESIWALLWGIPKVLKQNYGQVVVNFGEPIPLNDVLEKAPDWDGKPVARTRSRRGCRHGRHAGRADPGAHQRRRRRQSDQPAGAGIAVHAQARDGRGRPDRADRAVQALLVEMPYSDRVTVTRTRRSGSSPTPRKSTSSPASSTRSATCSASAATPRCC
jgi:glycerol-3-phosphate O-acyltransferase